MTFTLEKDRIIIENSEYFDAEATLTCGQIFRYGKTADGNYFARSADKYCEIRGGKRVEIHTDAPEYFADFFDLNRDYAPANRAVRINPAMTAAAEAGKGIRILRNDLFEVIVSFIISANNNIKRIQKILEDISDGGVFPAPVTLAEYTAEDFFRMGCGYRAPYLAETSKILARTDFLKELRGMDTVAARKRLLTLKGVGGKVADCILLFGLARADVFPVDTWIEKAYREYFAGQEKDREKITAYFLRLFGENAGLAQQYLFHYKRNLA